MSKKALGGRTITIGIAAGVIGGVSTVIMLRMLGITAPPGVIGGAASGGIAVLTVAILNKKQQDQDSAE